MSRDEFERARNNFIEQSEYDCCGTSDIIFSQIDSCNWAHEWTTEKFEEIIKKQADENNELQIKLYLAISLLGELQHQSKACEAKILPVLSKIKGDL